MKEHLSSHQIAAWLVGEPAAEAVRHARECPACRAEVEGLRDTLSQFRLTGERWSAHHMAQPAGRSRRSVAWAASIALAASILAAAVFVVKTPHAPVANVEAPFIAIPYVAPLAPYERASVLRMDVPVAALVAAGFRVQGAEPAATVAADVLIGQDGRPHAVRLISQGSVIQ